MLHHKELSKRLHMNKNDPTLCWFCSKATCNGCSWSKDFKPVEGWVAEPTSIIMHSGKDKRYGKSHKIIESFKVYSCPDFAEG